MTTFRQLLDQFEESARTRAAKGRAFEVFCEAFFQVDPYWKEQFDQVWAWSDWPGKDNRSDTGIDLVARQRGTGELTAIQCKFYSPGARLSWSHVSTFVGMLGQADFAEGMIVSTAGTESANVHANLDRLEKPVRLWRVDDFEGSRVDWDQFSIATPSKLALREPKTPYEYQVEAIQDVVKGFQDHDRGQLIMACGTGKTFTSLRLAEETVGAGGSVLFMVPSINLLSQSVLAWANDATVPLSTHAVCSDTKAGRRRRDDDMSANDLAFPASTDAAALVHQIEAQAGPGRMTAVFSTYQSIDVITEAHRLGLGEFDLIICDEAHRTTGAFRDESDQSMFTRVHDDSYAAGKCRLYMTATPRIYGDQTKAKAAQDDVIVASMDDEACYGPEFHNLSFGDAVARGLLTDYKVLVLAVNEDAVAGAFQAQLAEGGELALNDMARMIGCWHGLSKRGPQFDDDNVPMERAVAFSNTIKQSEAFTEAFPAVVNSALEDRSHSNAVMVEGQHVDGTTNVKVRSEAIAWLEEPPGQRVCRVLSNARCLTEGVDVPALDAVMFLQARKSIVDVVQAVGRVMRKSAGKDYGYVILPIGIPAGVSPEEALRDHESYQVVWQVLQALRSHDDRLRAEINKIDINRSSSKVKVIGIGMGGGSDPADPDSAMDTDASQGTLDLPDLQAWCDALYARIVDKVGDRRYMESWAEDISAIAQAQETRIRNLLDHPDQNPEAVERFDRFHKALRESLNDGVTRDDAIGMLSQHLITRPVFEALFGGDRFTRHNPVSLVMQDMIDTLDDANLQTETKTLEGFYEHIRMLIGGIDTAEGRQRVITELYEKFFKKALPKTAESLGIVYTPIEIVDFINRGVDELLQEHFEGTRITDEGVHVLDPFTGTGTFIARLLQSGLIDDADLARKYTSELHANEIMLLAYYIAAINIETVYNTLAHSDDPDSYEPFDGIVLADTFTLTEDHGSFDRVFFPENNERAEKQQQLDIRVILGNPPYSVDDRLDYPVLDESIRTTYVARATDNVTSLYDSYVRAFRLASDRIEAGGNGGVVAFVSNGGWLDSKSGSGVRASFRREFHHVYVYNLRGNQRTSGERSRREGGKVFGAGSRNTVTITFLVRQPQPVPATGAEIHYRDIGDYLTSEEKLGILAGSTVGNTDWIRIWPNEHSDWLEQRDPRYENLLPLEGDDGLFLITSSGFNTNRDAWMFNSSAEAAEESALAQISAFNAAVGEIAARANEFADEGDLKGSDVETASKFVWTEKHRRMALQGQRFDNTRFPVIRTLYRPFFPQSYALNSDLAWSHYQLERIYAPGIPNRTIAVVGKGSKQPFGVLACETPISRHMIGSDATMVLARWVDNEQTNGSLPLDSGVTRTTNLRASAHRAIEQRLGHAVSEDDIFAYVYGVLHSPEFRETFKVNLKKEAPRVPLVSSRAEFDAFAEAGQELLDLHIGYEDVKPYPLVEKRSPGSDPDQDPGVLLVGSRRMRYPRVTDPDTGKKVPDKTQLIYNEHLTIEGIPLEAHEYVLGTRSGIDWIIDRWYVKTDKKSGIVNDVNQWGLERGEPRYIIDLIGRVVTVSLRTVEIVESLPKLTL